MSEFRKCSCDWDPEFHRNLNIIRDKEDQGSACTNLIYSEVYMQQGGVCLSCVFGCAE